MKKFTKTFAAIALIMSPMAALADSSATGTATGTGNAASYNNDIDNVEGSVVLGGNTAHDCVLGVGTGVPGSAAVMLNVPLRSCRIFAETTYLERLYGKEYAREHFRKIARVNDTVNTVNKRKQEQVRAESTVSSRQSQPQRYKAIRIKTADGRSIPLTDQSMLTAYHGCKTIFPLGKGQPMVKANCTAGSVSTQSAALTKSTSTWSDNIGRDMR